LPDVVGDGAGEAGGEGGGEVCCGAVILGAAELDLWCFSAESTCFGRWSVWLLRCYVVWSQIDSGTVWMVGNRRERKRKEAYHAAAGDMAVVLRGSGLLAGEEGEV
jgi:hypothetical protein